MRATLLNWLATGASVLLAVSFVAADFVAFQMAVFILIGAYLLGEE